MHLLSKLHARLGDFWWYSLLLFAALRCGDLINAFVGLWLVPKYVSPEELGAVLPLMSFSTFIGFPMAVLMIVFSRYIVRFHARNDHGRMKSAIYWFIGLAVALNVGSGLLAVFAMPGFFDRIRVVKGSLGVLILAAGLLGAISPVFTRALQGLKEFHAITFLNLLSAPVRLVVMLVALPFRALSGYMLGQAAAPAFQIATSALVLRKHLRNQTDPIPFWKGEGREFQRYFSLVFLALGIGSFGAFVMPLIIRQRLPEVQSAAYYMISRFAELATYAGATLVFVMFPLVSEAQENGKRTIRLLVNTMLGTFGFGIAAALALYFLGGYIFELLPTCRPYSDYIPDMALLAFALAFNYACANFSEYEFACGRFAFLWWSLPLGLAQSAFLVCFTGYTFFNGILPQTFVDWMGSLNIASLRNIIWTLIAFASIRAVFIFIQLLARHSGKTAEERQ